MFAGAKRRHALLTLALCAPLLTAIPAIADSPSSPPTSIPTTLPPATYPSSFSQEQWITMDDGIQLGATITFPSVDGKAPAAGKFPVVLDMTPYGRDGACACDSATDLATRGLVLAVVDVRGTGGSQGNLDGNYFSPREGRDGYDLVEYLGTRTWSNGKVGMSGGSYLGIMQYLVAEQDPPHLAAIVPDEALADVYSDAAYPGGILSFSFDSQYLAVQGGPGLLTPNTSPSMLPGTIGAKLDQAEGRSIAFDYLNHNYDDAFYQERSPITLVNRITVPVLVVDGWRDAFEAGDLRMYEALEKRPGVETDLHIDPCTHKGCGGVFAPTDNPPDTDDIEAQEIQFFQRYLMDENVASLPRVRVYVQQQNKYINTTAWPPPSTSFVTEYLGAGTISGVKAAHSSESYVTNPTAGYSLALDEQGTVAASPYLPLDQRLEDGQGLTWRSGALTQPVVLDGPIALHLVASSTATNTDWYVKVSDVAPDGSESIVTEGQLRASLRQLAPGSTPTEPLETLDSPQAIVPGTFYDYDIAVAPTAYRFAAGDRLQVRVTSYDMPNGLPATIHFDDADPAATSIVPLLPAVNTVRLGGADPTWLSLPVAKPTT